jgi:SHS2 domain-containing protein
MARKHKKSSFLDKNDENSAFLVKKSKTGSTPSLTEVNGHPYNDFMKPYHTFDHTADLGLVITGSSEEALFANAAYAVFDIITDLARVDARETRRIAAEGDGREDLLINFLREVLYLYNGKRWLLKELRIVRISEKGLEAEARGEPLDAQKHEICKEIKAVTYHQAQIHETPDGWTARVIFDV